MGTPIPAERMCWHQRSSSLSCAGQTENSLGQGLFQLCSRCSEALVPNSADSAGAPCAAAVQNKGTPRAETASAEPTSHQPPNQPTGKRQLWCQRAPPGLCTGSWCSRQALGWLQATSGTLGWGCGTEPCAQKSRTTLQPPHATGLVCPLSQ